MSVVKYEYRNNQGKAAGSFDKFDIYTALTENTKIKTDWVEFLREHQDEILKAKAVPKPIEDVNDAVTLMHIGQKAIQEQPDIQIVVSFLSYN